MKIILILTILAVIIGIVLIIITWLYDGMSSFGRCNMCGGTIKRFDHEGYRHFICQGCGNEIIIKLPNKK